MTRYLPLLALALLAGCALQPVGYEAPSPWVTTASPSEDSRIRAGVAPKYGAEVFESKYDPALEHRCKMQQLAPVKAHPKWDLDNDPGMHEWWWVPQFTPRDANKIPLRPEEEVCRDHRSSTPMPVDEVVDPEREITIDFVKCPGFAVRLLQAKAAKREEVSPAGISDGDAPQNQYNGGGRGSNLMVFRRDWGDGGGRGGGVRTAVTIEVPPAVKPGVPPTDICPEQSPRQK